MKSEKEDNSLQQKESSQWISEYAGISLNTMTCWIPSLCPQCSLRCLAWRTCLINYSWSDLNCIEWWNEFGMLPSYSIPLLLLPFFIPYTCVKTGKFSELPAADLRNEEEEKVEKEEKGQRWRGGRWRGEKKRKENGEGRGGRRKGSEALNRVLEEELGVGEVGCRWLQSLSQHSLASGLKEATSASTTSQHLQMSLSPSHSYFKNFPNYELLSLKSKIILFFEFYYLDLLISLLFKFLAQNWYNIGWLRCHGKQGFTSQAWRNRLKRYLQHRLNMVQQWTDGL